MRRVAATCPSHRRHHCVLRCGGDGVVYDEAQNAGDPPRCVLGVVRRAFRHSNGAVDTDDVRR